MEITTQQLHEIENYLAKIKFDFVDLNAEILDHITSDVESLLDKNYSFENAFALVKLRWERHFKDTSSFFFGLQYSESKIVVKKAVKMFKPFYFIYLTAYFLPVIILKTFSFDFSKNTQDFLNGFLFYSASIAFLYMIFIIVKTIQTKVKTTYRFILKTQYLGIIFLILSLLMENSFTDKGNPNAILIGFLFGGFAVTYICHHFYKKHLEAIKKYKI
ncbi:MAG: hypothetical protein ACI9Z4_000159 [Polaribacter sp.]|jgi:hypothetical protein